VADGRLVTEDAMLLLNTSKACDVILGTYFVLGPIERPLCPKCKTRMMLRG
jgi:hypothetical protein